MKRFMFLVAMATVVMGTLLASGQAEDSKEPVKAIGRVKGLSKVFTSDLAVVEFSGAYDGTDYHVGGKVKNVGTSDYSRTRLLTGAFEGRVVRIYAINKERIGRSKLLHTYSVPSLKVNETWATPSMKISPHEVPGTGNAEFLMVLSDRDPDRTNDFKRINVSLVR